MGFVFFANIYVKSSAFYLVTGSILSFFIVCNIIFVLFNVKSLNKISDIPINKIMLETDAPYLTPSPYRGKRNEPYMIKYIAEKISQIKNIPLEEVRNQTTQTAKEFFGI